MDVKPLIVITGISGLIGARIARAVADNYRIVGLDLKEPTQGTARHLERFLKCDLTSADSTTTALGRLRADQGDQIASVIHLAAYYDFAGTPSPLYEDLTIEGTRRLIEGLRDFRVDQFVFASTLLVMEPAHDESTVIREGSPQEDEPWAYPWSKQQAERVLAGARRDIPVVILRIAGVYDEDGNSIPIAQQVARIHKKQIESYVFPGNPDHGQPFVHLDDLAHCVRRVVDKRETLGGFEVFLVAEPEVVSYDELQNLIGEAIHGREWPTIRIPKVAAKVGAWAKGQVGDDDDQFIKPWMVDLADAHYPVEITRIQDRVGWTPRSRLRAAIPEIVRRLQRHPHAWYRHHQIDPPEADQ